MKILILTPFRKLLIFPSKYNSPLKATDGMLAIEISCFFTTSATHGIGNYAKLLLDQIVELHIPTLFFIQSKSGIKSMVRLDNESAVKFQSIDHYSDLETFIRINKIEKMLFLSPFEEEIDSFIASGVVTYTVLYDLIPLYRPWQFYNLASYINYLKKINQLQSTCIFTISSHTKSEYLRIFPKHESIFVLPVLSNRKLNFTDFKSQTSELKENGIIVFAGKDPRKNLARVLIAWRKANLPSGFQLIIIGLIPLWLKNLIKTNIHYWNIDLLSVTSDSKKIELFKNNRFILCPSLDEGLGLPLIESFQYQMIPIYSNIPSHREIVKSGGIAFDAISINSLRIALSLVTEEKSLEFIKLRNHNQTLHEIFSLAKMFKV